MPKSKVYIFSGLAISLSIVAYFFITKKKKLPPSEIPKVDASGEEITKEQTVIPESLAALMKLSAANATKALRGKDVYTKLNDANAREVAWVNNGVINNLIGTIKTKGTYVGKILDVEEDGNGARNGDRIYKWVMIAPTSKEARKDLGTDRPIYLREDVINLTK